MKKIIVKLGLTFFFICSMQTIQAQAPLYEINTLQKIEVYFSNPNWDYKLDSLKNLDAGSLMADWVKINGIQYDSVGVKYKGNSSYDSTKIKNPLHITLDKYKNQNYQGYKDIKLSNGYSDPSMIREVLGYSILGNYMDCPKSNFAQLYINGNYIGVYSNDESIDKKFCADKFYSSANTFIKGNPIVTPSATTKCNLKYKTADSSVYQNFYEIKSNTGWNDLVKLCDTVTNVPASVESTMDIDRAIWMLAFNNVMVNLDSYNGAFCQNYYLYKDNNNRYNPTVWDLNMCFGGFPFAGSGSTSLGTLTNITTMAQLAIDNHATDNNWPLINDIQSNPMYKRMYMAHIRTMVNEQITNANYVNVATQLLSNIDTAVLSDNNKFFTYAQFQTSMNANVGNIPGIENLMSARLSYVQGDAEFMKVAPVISATSTTTSPAYNSTIVINAQVSNSNSVTVGYRFDKTKTFQKLVLFDDGNHNDGAAGDNNYGASLVMAGAQLQYYFYAENADAGVFSPARAEHEFYSLHATSSEPTANQIVINEILANNVSDAKDEYDDYEDWVELYNNTSSLINLSNLTLSNTQNNLFKWHFPPNTTIAPNGYFTIWTDDDSLQQIFHTNFNLSKDSGIILLTNASGTILDSITFGAQVADSSFGRLPNGTGSFVRMHTTYGYENNNFPIGIAPSPVKSEFNLYPNPATNQVVIEFDGSQKVVITDLFGRLKIVEQAQNILHVNVENWMPGIYLVKCGNAVKKLMVKGE